MAFDGCAGVQGGMEDSEKMILAGICGNWNSRLYVVSLLILVRFRKPWRAHS